MPNVFLDALGNEIPYDGTSPNTWRTYVYVIAFAASLCSTASSL